FAWSVTSDPAVPTNQRSVSHQIARIETPDDATVAIEWKGPYPFAGAIVEEDLGPLPEHLLGELYAADPAHLADARYWTRDFVGVGPYRLAAWDPGSSLELVPYDGFYGGRARIDSVVVRFMSDHTAVVAAMLAGAIDGELPKAIEFEDAMFLQTQWALQGRT